MSSLSAVLLLLVVATATAAGSGWNVSKKASYSVDLVERIPPMVGKEDGTSSFFLNCNPAYLNLPDGRGALLVRVQNCSRAHDNCPDERWETLGPSYLALVKQTRAFHFEYLSDDAIVFGPDNIGPEAAYGTEDPRIIYRERDGLYYLTFTAAREPGVKTSYFATSRNPADKNGWTVHGLIPGAPGGAALLLRDDTGERHPTHYLFATDDGLAGSLEIGVSTDLRTWTMTGKHLLVGRPGEWDAEGVAAGPSPMRLSNGNYVFFYPTDHHGQHPKYGRCALGWAILDGHDPTNVIERCSAPLMIATTSYEKEGFTPNVIFTTGLQRVHGTMDEFYLYYGGADTVVAAAHVKVSVNNYKHTVEKL